MNEGVGDCGTASLTSYRNGCRCTACREAHLSDQKRRVLRRAKEGPLMVDATAARERLLELSAAGMPQREMCNYGLSLPTVQRIMSGQRTTIRKDTQDKILAIDGRRPNRNQRVNPKGSIELVRKWRDRGLEFGMISRLTGVSDSTLRELYDGRKSWVYARTAVRLRMHSAEVFDALVCMAKDRKGSRNGKDDKEARRVRVHEGGEED